MEALTAYPRGTPQNVVEPIDLPDVKSYLSIRENDTSQDAFLRDSIPMCRAILEQHLPEYMITAQVRARVLAKPIALGSRTIIKVKGPVKTLISCAVTPFGSETPEYAQISIIDDETIMADLSEFHENVRIDLVYTVGSVPDPRARAALLTMIRNRYDRKYEDPYTEEVRRMVYPLMRLNA